MYRLVAEQQKMAVSLRLLQDGREVATAMLPLSEAVKLAGKQRHFIDFEDVATSPAALPPEVRREEIGKLSPREESDFRSVGDGQGD